MLYRNFIRRKGHTLAHIMADGEFRTGGLAITAATEPTFDFSFSNPHCQSQNGLAEADIRRWDKGVRSILDHAMRDPKSHVSETRSGPENPGQRPTPITSLGWRL